MGAIWWSNSNLGTRDHTGGLKTVKFDLGLKRRLGLKPAAGTIRLMDSILNAPVDVAADFFERDNFVFVAKRLVQFDPSTGRGSVGWDRHRWKIHYAFNNMGA